MKNVTVSFLGEEYLIPETINEFLSYDTLLNPIREKMLNEIMTDIKQDTRCTYGAAANRIHNTSNKYRQLIKDASDLLVEKFIELGIYDITNDDLLSTVNSIGDINKVENLAFSTLLKEGHRYVDLKNAGLEQAYNYAAQNIVGSGVKVFTNSISVLMINSAIEKNILLSQAKKADKEYEDAVKIINEQTVFALDRLYREVMIKEFYPNIARIILEFDSKIMVTFLMQLTTHNKFDFDSVENYDMQKADGMLKNICKVPNKNDFLKQVFLICPFSFELYKECLEQGLLDKGTFETAKYFGMGEEIAVQMESYINNNLSNIEKIKPIITLLSSYRKQDELSICKKIYESTLINIEGKYKLLNSAISDKGMLDRFIRENISNITFDIINKSNDDIATAIDSIISSIITEKQFEEFVNIGILLPEKIKMLNSSSTTLMEINYEIKSALTECIMEYIEEAKRRLDLYNHSMAIFNKEVKKKEQALNVLKTEKAKLGLFSFSKKKELANSIFAMENEITTFKKMNEPKDLQIAFERMYG